MTEIFNQEWSIEWRRELRNRPTKAERLLWFYLRRKQVSSVIFRRQYNMGKYITDFYAPSLRLVVEVDGDYHNLLDARVYDRKRTAYFSELGLHVIRFTNDEVYTNIDSVLDRIRDTVVIRSGLHPL